MDRHTKQQIKREMREQHNILLYEYKNATLLEIPYGCSYSMLVVFLGVCECKWAAKVGELVHLCVKQLRDFMIHLTFPSLPPIFHPVMYSWHVSKTINDVNIHILFS